MANRGVWRLRRIVTDLCDHSEGSIRLHRLSFLRSCVVVCDPTDRGQAEAEAGHVDSVKFQSTAALSNQADVSPYSLPNSTTACRYHMWRRLTRADSCAPLDAIVSRASWNDSSRILPAEGDGRSYRVQTCELGSNVVLPRGPWLIGRNSGTSLSRQILLPSVWTSPGRRHGSTMSEGKGRTWMGGGQRSQLIHDSDMADGHLVLKGGGELKEAFEKWESVSSAGVTKVYHNAQGKQFASCQSLNSSEEGAERVGGWDGNWDSNSTVQEAARASHATGEGTVMTSFDAVSGTSHVPVAAPSVVDAVAAGLDGIHSLTGAPWWLTIVGMTLLLRSAMVPLTVMQIRKAAQIGAVMSTIMPKKGEEGGLMRLIDGYNRLRKDAKLPSLAWIAAVPLVQVPLFVTCMLTIRRMSIGSHPGFDTGGALWFTDLTAAGTGLPSIVFPTLVTGMFLANLQVSFGRMAVKGHMGTVLKWYKRCLQALAVPTFAAGFYLPQGVFMYWLTSNTFSLAQSLALRQSSVRQFLQLPSLPSAGVHGGRSYDTLSGNIRVLDLERIKAMSADQLVEIAAQLRAAERTDEAIKILRLAIQKDTKNVGAYMGLAKMHANVKKWEEAAEFYGIVADLETRDEVRGSAIFGAGVSLSMQGRNSEAISCLEECVSLQPQNGVALVTLASILSKEGLKEDALRVLRKAAELDPAVITAYIQPLEMQIAAGQAPEINVSVIDEPASPHPKVGDLK